MPHSSAHWPPNVWPASAGSTVNSKLFVWPGTTSRLNRNCGTYHEWMTSALSSVTWIFSPTGTAIPPHAGFVRLGVLQSADVVPYWPTCWVATTLPLPSRYSNDHWNWAATTWTRTSGSGLTASTVLSVWYEIANRYRTMTVGMRVQMISTRLLPWVWGGSSSSPARRR